MDLHGLNQQALRLSSINNRETRAALDAQECVLHDSGSCWQL
jgi:hypothetical protein